MLSDNVSGAGGAVGPGVGFSVLPIDGAAVAEGAALLEGAADPTLLPEGFLVDLMTGTVELLTAVEGEV